MSWWPATFGSEGVANSRTGPSSGRWKCLATIYRSRCPRNLELRNRHLLYAAGGPPHPFWGMTLVQSGLPGPSPGAALVEAEGCSRSGE